jgi:hypothetical protein
MERFKMKKIVFHQRELFLMFVFSMQEKYNLQKSKDNYKYFEYPAFKCNDFIIVYKEDGIINLEYLDTCDIFVSDFYSMYDEKGENDPLQKSVYHQMESRGMKCLLVDAEGEGLIHFEQFLNFDEWKNELIEKENLYVITQRTFIQDIENKIVTNQVYLPLLYYYYHLSDSLFLQPQLPEFSAENKKYDFISYLGLNTDYKSKSSWRNNILLNVDFNDKKLYTPTSYKQTKPIQRMLDNIIPWPRNNFGSYSWFSVIESELAKIKLVFETEAPDNIEDDVYSFLTEKTLKCFLHTQPYFIFHKKIQREHLKDLGFEFVGGDIYEDTIDKINKLCKENIDDWIIETKPIFQKNKDTFYKIIFDSNMPHIKLLENIIYET